MKRKDNIFLDAMFRRPQSNRFDLSHEVKYSTDLGRLVPTCVQEVLPGDVFNLASTDFCRFFPLKSPVMHRFRMSKHWFFIPNRILWEAFPNWIFDVDNSDENPYVIIDDVVGVGSLADYMGIPPGDYSNIPGGYKVNLLPFAAYYLVHDEFYKQQFIEPMQMLDIVPGDNSSNWLAYVLAVPLKAAWEKDYFTTCMPTPQDGATGVQIPLTFQDDIPVDFTATPGLANAQVVYDLSTGLPSTILGALANGPGPAPIANSLHQGGTPVALAPPLNNGYTVDVQSDAALITDLRRAFRLQEFLEKVITGGKRYIETLMTIFGVKSSDTRLQRPEYIFGNTNNVVVSEVLATTEGTDQSLGQMGGHALMVGGSDSRSYRAEEHGWILCLSVIRPDTSYQDGLARHFTRNNPLDYAIPDFALIGEQTVLRKEIQAALGVGVDPDAVFGYQKRYSEYMYQPSRVAGQMRTTLAFWHNGRIFDNPVSPPALNAGFIKCNPRLDIFAVVDAEEDNVIIQTMNHVSVSRKLPRYAIPTI